MDSDKKNIILVGGGGHCKSCIEVIESTGKYNIKGILDLPSELGKKVLGYKVIGNDQDYLKYKNQGCCFLITAGQIKSAALRKRIYLELKKIDAPVVSVIASSATVSRHAIISEGSVILHSAVVNAGAKIGVNCIINTGAVVDHDSVVGNHTHISASAVVTGDCTIGNETFIGSNSCIGNGLSIGDNIVLGAGSTVTKNIEIAGIYVGSPAKKI